MRNRTGLRRWSLMSLCAFVSLFLSTSAIALAAPLNAPQAVIQKTSDRILDILNKDRAHLHEDPQYVYQLAYDVMDSTLDFRRMCALVLGKNWRKATPEQRDRFVEQFKLLLVRTYATAFSDLQQWELDFMPMRGGGNNKRMWIHTEVHYANKEPIKVSYLMRNYGNEVWKAYDVKIEGISLVTNYRNSFSQEVRKNGLDGLIQKMARRNQEKADADAESHAADHVAAASVQTN
ncbi:MAG: ABC transporter substrate-binding protein [gamma proteobacterium symbiont of Bathyaustriella thionipta]|nr:ABC transporter substrate-binding protein [gamma proteobacterium symbiont of Bathyaustriella thionipta]